MTKNLKILSEKEIEELYSMPAFNKEEQTANFYLDSQEVFLMQGFSTMTSQIYFILQLGYFKAKQQFYVFDTGGVMDDIGFIMEVYFQDSFGILEGNISKPTRLRQQQIIKKLLGFKECGKTERVHLFDKAKSLARIHNKPAYIFGELLNYLRTWHIILPAYTTLQRDFVSASITYEKKRLGEIIDALLSTEELKMFDNLINMSIDEGETTRYLLTYLQKEPASYKYQEMRKQAKRKEELEPLYGIAKSVIPRWGISIENIKYYSSLAHHYTIFSLGRFESQIRYVYLICFVFHHYRHINDILTEAFGINISFYQKKKKDFALDKISENSIEVNAHLGSIPSILNFFTSEEIPDDIPFGKIREQVFGLLSKNEFQKMMGYLLNTGLDQKDLEWQFIDGHKRRITQNIRYMFLQTTFSYNNPGSALKKAADFLKQVFNTGIQPKQIDLEEIPLGFMDQKTKKYIFADEKSSFGRYEFLVYQELGRQIDSGEIYITESNRYKNFDEDLIAVENWKNKDVLLKELDLQRLKMPIEKLLGCWDREIDLLYKSVNRQIHNNENEDIRISEKGGRTGWKFGVRDIQEDTNHSLYRKFEPIKITQLFQLVEKHTGFLNAFDHLLKLNVKEKADRWNLYAGILAYGTNLGLKTMSSHSDISYYGLKNTAENYLLAENLKAANDKISNAIANLPMFRHYAVESDIIHSSSDGQRYESRFDTVNSRYSSKYFGLGKGVSAYTMVANHVPVNAKIIGTHEHESHFVFDIIYNNSSEISPDIHSTDTHGTNQINFAILDMFGYQFAPRYKNLSDKTEKLYSFKQPSYYAGDEFIIRPSRKIDEKLIISEWDNIQRILVSLALKSTSQSSIIRKLSSYKRRNSVQKAFWEYDNVVKTHYLLSFINNKHLRGNVQKALNRGEAYHKLRRYIFYADKGKFKVHSAQEQQIWSECTRLIANSIIYYNTHLLSLLLEREEKNGNDKAMEVLKTVSPIAWQHIHIYGSYQFSQDNLDIDIEKFLKETQII